MKNKPLKLGMQYFAVKNLAIEAEKKSEILQRMSVAIKDNDTEGFSQAWTDLADTIQQAVLEESKELMASNDAAVLAQRGIRQLTGVESKYWQKMIDAMKSSNPKQAIIIIDDVMPKTVIDDVFTYLTENHPLLDAVNFQNTGAIVEWIMSTSSGVAGWGELCDEIEDELSGAFSVIELGKQKLSAFIPVCNAMLDLGPTWLDRYVRTLLAEAIATALEAAIVDGDGDGKPLGMTRALSGATDGVYPRKSAVAITALDPETYGNILNTLSQAPNSKRRSISSVLLVVNPADYFTKVFPATTPRTADGGFNYGVFPFPTTVIQSAAVPSGHAVMGLGSRYFMGLGTGAGKGGKIEYSDDYKFLEDQRVYRVKMYGNGKPMDENAFVYLDIGGLVPTIQKVYVTGGPIATVSADAQITGATLDKATVEAADTNKVTVASVSYNIRPAEDATLAYLWQIRAKSGTTWADLTSAYTGYNTADLTVKAADIDKHYRCKVTATGTATGIVYTNECTVVAVVEG